MRDSLYARSFRKASDTRRFIITSADDGWQVREEAGGRVVREVRYDDWHRVERAKRSFSLTAASLADAGWTESR